MLRFRSLPRPFLLASHLDLPARSPTMANSPESQPARILVVEDEGIVAMDLKGRLEALGYTVVDTVSSGEDAIRRATELHPDLALVDIRLSGDMDGIEAARRIRAASDIP